MMRVLILMLSFFVAGGTDRVSTTCTAEACLTLHLEEKDFEKASENCVNNGGNLVTMRNDNEFQSIKSALLAAEDSIFNSKLWIGLELMKKSCIDLTEELYGFRWTSKPSESKYSNWKKKPLRTCTEKRCVSISLADDLKWTDGSCRDGAFYMCKFLSKGMCKPIVMEEPGDVKYNLPFLTSQTQNEKLAMLPHGTWGEIRCSGSVDAESFISICDNKDGIFGWTNSERFCARDERSCARKNGGCDHLCSETAGTSVRCECRDGYYLMEDQVSCALRTQNNCENAPCESECMPTATGFSCACADGFQVAEDNISCVDIDECRQRICGELKCQNAPGSYFCECNPGFKLVAGKCVDVDECTESRCDQGCLNSQGSFSCYCHAGYISSDVGGKCIDKDECLGKPCEDICLNTVGSFKCSCRENFILAKNGISCVQKPQSTPSPDNREAFITELSQFPVSFESTTINSPPLNKTNSKVDSSKRKESFLGSYWILVCVLASVIPLVAFTVLISVFVIYRWKRSRKDTLKNTTADNYCWVSSGLDKERKKSNIQLNNCM